MTKEEILAELDSIRNRQSTVTALPEWISENIFIRPNVLPNTGDKIDGHDHNFPHTMFMYTGRVHIRTFTKGEQCAECSGTGQVPPFPPYGDTTCKNCKGRGFLLVLGREGDFDAPDHVLIRAGVWHEITSTEDRLSMQLEKNECEELAACLAEAPESVRKFMLEHLRKQVTKFHCVYSHRDPQGKLSLKNEGWAEAYC